MDIRIGNDIRIDVTLDNLGIASAENVLQVECILINTRFNSPRPNVPVQDHFHDCVEDHHIEGDTLVIDDPCDKRHDHSEYTIGNHHNPKYNVYPYSPIAKHFFTAPSHNCMRFNYPHHDHRKEDKEYIHADSYLSEEDSMIYMYLPTNKQRCGKYELVLKVTINDDNWKGNTVRTCTFDYGKVFKIVDDEFGQCGTVIVELPKYSNFQSNIKTSDDFSSSNSIKSPFYYGTDTPANVFENLTVDQIKEQSASAFKTVSKPFDFAGGSQIFYALYKVGTYADPIISQDQVVIVPTWYTENEKFPGYVLKWFNINGEYTCETIKYYTEQNGKV